MNVCSIRVLRTDGRAHSSVEDQLKIIAVTFRTSMRPGITLTLVRVLELPCPSRRENDLQSNNIFHIIRSWTHHIVVIVHHAIICLVTRPERSIPDSTGCNKNLVADNNVRNTGGMCKQLNLFAYKINVSRRFDSVFAGKQFKKGTVLIEIRIWFNVDDF